LKRDVLHKVIQPELHTNVGQKHNFAKRADA